MYFYSLCCNQLTKLQWKIHLRFRRRHMWVLLSAGPWWWTPYCLCHPWSRPSPGTLGNTHTALMLTPWSQNLRAPYEIYFMKTIEKDTCECCFWSVSDSPWSRPSPGTLDNTQTPVMLSQQIFYNCIHLQLKFKPSLSSAFWNF